MNSKRVSNRTRSKSSRGRGRPLKTPSKMITLNKTRVGVAAKRTSTKMLEGSSVADHRRKSNSVGRAVNLSANMQGKNRP